MRYADPATEKPGPRSGQCELQGEASGDADDKSKQVIAETLPKPHLAEDFRPSSARSDWKLVSESRRGRVVHNV